jgi:glycosyltransferase involved in cell wall biosynthesis
MQISVLYPPLTVNATAFVTAGLDRSAYPIHEVIIVDSGNDRLVPGEFSAIKNFPIHYISSERSVCIQRNAGVRQAISEWIFLCDDDIESH